jgi:flavodoxin
MRPDHAREVAMNTHALIAYYSMGGHTRNLAHELRDVMGADIEEIKEPHPRHGIVGLARALVDAVARREPPIEPAEGDPRNYDVLLVGGPIWAGRMAAPVRSYVKRYAVAAPHVAFFCTEGGRGSDTAFADLESLCGRKPEATLVVDSSHLLPAEHRQDLKTFASRMSLSTH